MYQETLASLQDSMVFVTCSTSLREFHTASDEGLATRLEKSFHTPLCMKLFGIMCTYFFAYCVDTELPSNFLNRDAAREQEWTNKLVRNVIILVS